MFIDTLSTAAKKKKQKKKPFACPSRDEWINKLWVNLAKIMNQETYQE